MDKAAMKTFRILTYNTHLFEGSTEVKTLRFLTKILAEIPTEIKSALGLTTFIQQAEEKLKQTLGSLMYRDEDRAQAICEKIAAIEPRPDIVCLQEAWGESIQKTMIERLKTYYPFHYVSPPHRVSEADMPDIAILFKEKLGGSEEIWKKVLLFIDKLLRAQAPTLLDGLMVFSNQTLKECQSIVYAQPRFMTWRTDWVEKVISSSNLISPPCKSRQPICQQRQRAFLPSSTIPPKPC